MALKDAPVAADESLSFLHLLLIDMFESAKVIATAAMKAVCVRVSVFVTVCVHVCVWWASGLETARASAALYLFFSADGGCFL